MSDTIAVDNVYAPSTAAALYTNATGRNVTVIQASCTNKNASTDYEVIYYKVPSGGSAGDEQHQAIRMMDAKSSDIVEELLNVVLEDGDAIYHYCATADEITSSIALKKVT